MTVTNYLRSQAEPRTQPLPVVCRRQSTAGVQRTGILRRCDSPFSVTGDPNAPTFNVPNIGLTDQRASLLQATC